MMQSMAVPTSRGSIGLPARDGAFALTGAAKASEENLEKQVSRFVAGTFFSMMLGAMRKTVPEDGIMSGGRGEEVFRQMFDTELAERFSQTGSFPPVEAAIRQLKGQGVYRKDMPVRSDEPAMHHAEGVRS